VDDVGDGGVFAVMLGRLLVEIVDGVHSDIRVETRVSLSGIDAGENAVVRIVHVDSHVVLFFDLGNEGVKIGGFGIIREGIGAGFNLLGLDSFVEGLEKDRLKEP